MAMIAINDTARNTPRLPVITCDHCGLESTRDELDTVSAAHRRWFSNGDNTEHCCGCTENLHLTVVGTAREFSQRYADEVVQAELARALRRAAWVAPTLNEYNTTHHAVFSVIRALVGSEYREDCPEVGSIKNHIYDARLRELLPEYHPGELRIGPPRIVNATSVEFKTNVQPVRPVDADEECEFFVHASIRIHQTGQVEFVDPTLGWF